MASHRSFKRKVLGCRACPRLVSALAEYRQAHPLAHSAPVPASGSSTAHLLIVGLAPGRQGANRTGRVFVGDASGRFLHQSLHRCGLASDPDPFAARLEGVRMTNVLKCWPPGNKPATEELARCAGHLREELQLFWRPSVRSPRGILCLGRIAFTAIVQALEMQFPANPTRRLTFEHGRSYWLSPTLKLICSYHPSLQNVNTGRLDAAMLDAAVLELIASLDGAPAGRA